MAAAHEPAACLVNPESQPYLELHCKKCGQQGEGGEPAHLLCIGESSPAALHGESSEQERHGAVGACPKEGSRNDPQNGTAPLRGQAERRGCAAWRRGRALTKWSKLNGELPGWLGLEHLSWQER